MPPERIVILVGPPQSGKTTAAKFLESQGYVAISASAVISRLDNPQRPIVGRRELIARGEKMLAERGPEWFAEKLLHVASDHRKVVFDGIRPIRTIQRIRGLQPHTKVLLIKANEHLRRLRYRQERDASAVPYDEIINSDVEHTAEGIETIARVVSNESSPEDFFAELMTVI